MLIAGSTRPRSSTFRSSRSGSCGHRVREAWPAVHDEADVLRYLKARPWYRPDTTFSNHRLSAREKANIDVIRAAEARKHSQIETGDMRYYQNRVVTTAMLGHHTTGDWEVLAAEIGAVHGQTFMDEEPDGTDAEEHDVWVLQKYFDERYWYHRRKDFRPRSSRRSSGRTRTRSPWAGCAT